MNLNWSREENAACRVVGYSFFRLEKLLLRSSLYFANLLPSAFIINIIARSLSLDLSFSAFVAVDLISFRHWKDVLFFSSIFTNEFYQPDDDLIKLLTTTNFQKLTLSLYM